MYTFGSAGSSRTYRNNLEALERWRIIPRMLRNATNRNLEVSCTDLLSTDPRLDPITSLDHPLWRKAPLSGARRSRRCARNTTQGWRARYCEGSCKCRCATDHVDRGVAIDRSGGQGQRRWSPVVPAILVTRSSDTPGRQPYFML